MKDKIEEKLLKEIEKLEIKRNDGLVAHPCSIIKAKAKLQQHRETKAEYQKKIEIAIDKWIKENKTSCKYLKRKGFENAEEFGDVIILDINNHLLSSYPTAKENLIKEIFSEETENHNPTKEDIVGVNSKYELGEI